MNTDLQHTTPIRPIARTVLSGLTLAVALLAGGCGQGDEAKSSSSPDAPTVQAQNAGSAHKTSEITEGQAFSFDNFDYAAGWKITHGEVSWNIAGLEATNNSGAPHYNATQIKLWSGDDELVMLSCGAGKKVAPGATVALDLCLSTDPLPASYDKITINNF